MRVVPRKKYLVLLDELATEKKLLERMEDIVRTQRYKVDILSSRLDDTITEEEQAANLRNKEHPESRYRTTHNA